MGKALQRLISIAGGGLSLVFGTGQAHYLLQTRTSVLNGELRDHFEEWYPELSTDTHDEEPETPVKMAA